MLPPDSIADFLAANPEMIGRLQYSTFVLEKQKVMYLDTPKTGCTSIKLALCELDHDFEAPAFSDSLETTPELFIHDRRSTPLKSLTDMPEDTQQKILFGAQWKRFCVVRNPFDRVFSAWFSKVLLREPGLYNKLPGLILPTKLVGLDQVWVEFSRFIDYLAAHGTETDPHWDRQHRLLFMGQINWDVIIKYERLNEEFKVSGSKLNGLQLELPRTNESGFGPDWSKISERTIDQIKEIYELDFSEFGYDLRPVSGPDEGTRINAASLVNSIIARNQRLEQVFSDRDRIKELAAEAARLRQELNTVYRSDSWRYTSIFRAIAAFMRGGKSKTK